MFLNTTNKNSTTRFKKIEVHANGITLICKAKIGQQHISFDAIDKIYLSLNKRSVIMTYLYFSIVSCCIFIGLYWYSFIVLLATLFFLALVTSLLFYTYWINLNRYPTYRLVVKLKNGNFFIKNTSQARKEETISIINQIKKKMRLLR
ncbi:MAG: hypothetical protein RLZZ44_1574 [Bacteroidota bacterium]|jgi:Flp pilus assembly protein TadB